MTQSQSSIPSPDPVRWYWPPSPFWGYCPECGGDGLTLTANGFIWFDFLSYDIPFTEWKCWMCGFVVRNPTLEEIEEMRKHSTGGWWA